MNQKIDVNQIFTEVRTGGVENLDRWIIHLTEPAATAAVTNVLTHMSSESPTLLLYHLIGDSALTTVFKTLMAFAFEAGRLYGRTELINELAAPPRSEL